MEVDGSVLRMLASRLCALMRLVASDKAMAASEWFPMSLSTLFMSRGEPGSSAAGQVVDGDPGGHGGLVGSLSLSLPLTAVMQHRLAVERCLAGGS